MNDEITAGGPTRKIYDTEKLIDIHSDENDPSFDADLVRYATSRTAPRSKDLHNSSDISVNKVPNSHTSKE